MPKKGYRLQIGLFGMRVMLIPSITGLSLCVIGENTFSYGYGLHMNVWGKRTLGHHVTVAQDH